VIVAGTANVNPLGAKSTTGPMAVEPAGPFAATETVETPMLMVTGDFRALGGMTMLVPAIVRSSPDEMAMVPPLESMEAVFTYLLATFCGELLHAAKRATGSPARHVERTRDRFVETIGFLREGAFVGLGERKSARGGTNLQNGFEVAFTDSSALSASAR
jgi:hypothetical protein